MDVEKGMTKAVGREGSPLQQAVCNVIWEAFRLLDETANSDPPEIEQDAWDRLAGAMEALEDLIPEEEEPCYPSVAARLLVAESALSPTPTGEVSKGALGERVAEIIAEGDGFWRPCSGCQESVDGCVSYRDYPYSETFQCQPGGGCRECGGLGVIWDTTDYEAMAREILAPSPTDNGSDAVREEVEIQGSIYEGMSACIVRHGRTIAHVHEYPDALEIAAALKSCQETQA